MDSLEEFYASPSNPASFSGINKLNKHTNFSQKHIQDKLSSVENYTVHFPSRIRFPTRRIFAKHINYLFETDLSDLSKYKSSNNNYVFLLGVIDVLSKRAWVVPLHSKSAPEIIRAFKIIFAHHNTPTYLRSDRGKEFLNKPFQDFLKQNNVKHYVAHGVHKASVIERFWRTFKGKLMKYLHYNNTHRYIDVLDQLVESYNNTYHRSIKMSPSQVNFSNQRTVWQNLYGSGPTPSRKKPKFSIGQIVRLASTRFAFYKSFYPTFTHELFKISEIHRDDFPLMYSVVDLQNKPIAGRFYEKELVSANEDLANKKFHIDKILARRNRKALVSYKYYPPSFNQWIPIKDLEKINNK